MDHIEPKDIRHARARASHPGDAPPSQRDLARLFCTNQSVVARIERGRRQARGVLRVLALVLTLATARGPLPRKCFDPRTPPGERLAALFRAAYPEEKK